MGQPHLSPGDYLLNFLTLGLWGRYKSLRGRCESLSREVDDLRSRGMELELEGQMLGRRIEEEYVRRIEHERLQLRMDDERRSSEALRSSIMELEGITGKTLGQLIREEEQWLSLQGSGSREAGESLERSVRERVEACFYGFHDVEIGFQRYISNGSRVDCYVSYLRNGKETYRAIIECKSKVTENRDGAIRKSSFVQLIKYCKEAGANCAILVDVRHRRETRLIEDWESEVGIRRGVGDPSLYLTNVNFLIPLLLSFAALNRNFSPNEIVAVENHSSRFDDPYLRRIFLTVQNNYLAMFDRIKKIHNKAAEISRSSDTLMGHCRAVFDPSRGVLPHLDEVRKVLDYSLVEGGSAAGDGDPSSTIDAPREEVDPFLQ